MRTGGQAEPDAEDENDGPVCKCEYNPGRR